MITDTPTKSYPLTILSFGNADIADDRKSTVVLNGKMLRQTTKATPAVGYALIGQYKGAPAVLIGKISPFPASGDDAMALHAQVADHLQESNFPAGSFFGIVVAWTQAISAELWAAHIDDDYISTLKSWGAGAVLDDLHQKATQIPDCTGNLSYCMAAKVTVKNVPGIPPTIKGQGVAFEAADSRVFPSAALSLSIVPIQVQVKTSTGDKTVTAYELRETD